MSSDQQLPDGIATHLPSSDLRAVFVQTVQGPFIVAGKHALYVVADSGIEDAGLWHEVQFASWDAATRQLAVVWIDPDRPVVVLTTVNENPAQFMKIVTSRVDNVIVLSKSVTTPSGAIVSASVRRRVDGALFSTIIVKGKLTAADELLAQDLEDQVRRQLGLTD